MTDQDILDFEESARPNGAACWSARQFAEYLGYADFKSFRRAVEKAMTTCVRLNIPLGENFREVPASADGLRDWKLSRFACYLVAMNADPRKERVAKAQAYFAGLAESFREYLETAEDVERLVIRGDIADEERGLSGTAQTHGVQSYAFFQNAGYRGMYNMNLVDLRFLKQVPGKRSPLDFMYSTELAANLFRITQTRAKIQSEGTQGQQALERVAQQVGHKVRETMISLSGTAPEDLPAAPDIHDTKSRLRAAQRTLKRLDSPRPGRRVPDS